MVTGSELTVQIDPHGAAFWLDFLAVKSGNYEWILDAREKHADQIPMAAFEAYPGMAYAYALACRAREDAEKVKVSCLATLLLEHCLDGNV